MTTLDKLRWYFGYLFSGWCPDPACGGAMQMYDDRPHRDYCSNCHRSQRMLDRAPEVQERRQWSAMPRLRDPETPTMP
ncbi:MAG: hypothetical protein AAF098_19955 [Pseudomonadota bacterium]